MVYLHSKFFSLLTVVTCTSLLFISPVSAADAKAKQALRIEQATSFSQLATRPTPPRRTVRNVHRKNVSRQSVKRGKEPETINLFLDPEVQLDATTAVLENPTGGRDKVALGYYRTLSHAKFNSYDHDRRVYDELGEESFAQHLFIYYGTRELVDFIRRSPLGSTYEAVTRRVKRYGDYLSCGVGRADNGEFKVSQGRDRKRRRFLDMRLGFSSRSGVEPRLSLDDNINLRYSPTRSSTLLEYELNF